MASEKETLDEMLSATKDTNPLIEEQVNSDALIALSKPRVSARASEIDDSLCGTIKFVSTVSLSSMIRSAGDFGSYLILGYLDDDHLAASNLISTTNTFVIFTVFSGLYSVGGKTGRHFRDGKCKEIHETFKNGARLGFYYSIPSMAFALTSGYIFDLMGNSKTHTDILRSYFYTGTIGIPASILLMNAQQVSFGTFNVLPPNIVSLANSGLKVLLSYLLIYGSPKLGIPQLGAWGLGIANSVSAWLSLAAYTLYMLKSSRFKQYGFNLSREGLNPKVFWELINLGLPITIQIGSEFLVATISAAIMGIKMGDDALPSNQIAKQYLFFVMIPIFGTAQACNILVSRSKNALIAKQSAKNAFKVGAGFSGAVLIAFSTMPKIMVSAFRDVNSSANAGIVKICSWLFPENGINLFFDSFRLVAGGAIQGQFKDTKFAMKSALLCMGVIALPLGCALGLPAPLANLGPSGMYIARGVAFAVGGGALLLRWIKLINEKVSQELNQRLSAVTDIAVTQENVPSPTDALASAPAESPASADNRPAGIFYSFNNASRPKLIPDTEINAKLLSSTASQQDFRHRSRCVIL